MSYDLSPVPAGRLLGSHELIFKEMQREGCNS